MDILYNSTSHSLTFEGEATIVAGTFVGCVLSIILLASVLFGMCAHVEFSGLPSCNKIECDETCCYILLQYMCYKWCKCFCFNNCKERMRKQIEKMQHEAYAIEMEEQRRQQTEEEEEEKKRLAQVAQKHAD